MFYQHISYSMGLPTTMSKDQFFLFSIWDTSLLNKSNFQTMAISVKEDVHNILNKGSKKIYIRTMVFKLFIEIRYKCPNRFICCHRITSTQGGRKAHWELRHDRLGT